MAQLDIQTPREDVTTQAVASEEFQLDMVDFGSAYQAAEVDTACFRCFCGTGCFCGCTSF
ncbi:MAG: hypothetical protein AAGC60_23050 [Acidobacteriota bacterium]